MISPNRLVNSATDTRLFTSDKVSDVAGPSITDRALGAEAEVPQERIGGGLQFELPAHLTHGRVELASAPAQRSVRSTGRNR